jgi:arsenate reductase
MRAGTGCKAGKAPQCGLNRLPRGGAVSDVTIYHNPKCETSRNTLALIRNAGIEPTVIEYLQHPPTREKLAEMIKSAGLSVRAALREKGTPFAELGLGDPSLTDDQLLDAMMAHPILINRPFVITERGARLSRPSEVVLEILPKPQRGFFAKEDGEVVIDEKGERIGRQA